MPKLYTKIGFAPSFQETAPGVIEEVPVEKYYYGDVLQNTRRMESSDKVNSDITVSNRISIVADPYARENYFDMRYIEYMGKLWKIVEVNVQYPRLILTLGGLFNGQTPEN